MHVYPYQLPTECGADSVEFVDSDNRPLLVAPLAAAEALGMTFRSVGVALGDGKGRIFVRREKRDKGGIVFWDLSATGVVRCGESLEDAALRRTEETLGLPHVLLRPLAWRLPQSDSFGERLTLFLAGPALPTVPCDGMFLDAVELEALIAHFPEMVAPKLLWAAPHLLR